MIKSTDLLDKSQNSTDSWAIWVEQEPHDFSFFEKNLDKLHADVVILGLNRSDGSHTIQKKPFINFHAPSHRGDTRLKTYIRDGNLDKIIGAFMTDLSEEIQTNSNKVNIEKLGLIDNFIEKLKFYPAAKRTIICLGDKPFDEICKALEIKPSRIKSDPTKFNLRNVTVKVKSESWDIYRVWLHSSWGKFEEKGSTELPLQLQFINNNI